MPAGRLTAPLGCWTAPRRSPSRTSDDVAYLVEQIRRAIKFGAARIAATLQADHNITLGPVTVHRILVRLGISRVADLDPPSGDAAAPGAALRASGA